MPRLPRIRFPNAVYEATGQGLTQAVALMPVGKSQQVAGGRQLP